MSILKLRPQLVERIWGGRRLANDFHEIDSAPIGEAWIISGYPTHPSIINEGPYAGQSLRDLYHSHRELFANDSSPEFPLLVKLIDAAADLSVQVHPNDAYAARYANDKGKSESWLILDTEPNAQLQWGHKAQTNEQLVQLLDEGQWTSLLNYCPVHAGEVYYIPSGTVHALCRGTYLLEIQQSSDVTYRLYDYDRTDVTGKRRPLHIEDAKNVITVPAIYEPIRHIDLDASKEGRTTILPTPYFTIEHWVSINSLQLINREETYYLVFVLKGTGSLNGVTVSSMESVIITSDTRQIDITGHLSLIVSMPPQSKTIR